jgi:hypothetical protein
VGGKREFELSIHSRHDLEWDFGEAINVWETVASTND